MEEEDQDELLQVTDDDSISDVDDNCLPSENLEDENPRYKSIYVKHSKLEFILTKVALIFSSSCILILLPPYLDSVNVKSDAYNLIAVTATLTVVLLIGIIFCGNFLFKKYKDVRMCTLPMGFSKIFLLSAIYCTSGFIIIYASDRKRVLCHLQDPIKGIILVFSLLYYFMFCKKLMGLQRIFSATTIIVGLFIALDYYLCDEFRCRGFERVHVSDDTGNWSWKVHTTWLVIYILGLALFAGYFSLLDHYILNCEENVPISINISNTFLSTVSRSVSYAQNETNLYSVPNIEATNVTKRKSSVHVSLWIHIFGVFFVIIMFWVDLIPFIGKGSTSGFLQLMLNGIYCHFKPEIAEEKLTECGNVFVFSWLFLGSYVLFSITSIKFLMMCQSAVYTVATICMSLPLVGIWWSLFSLVLLENGGSIMVWAPSLSGELICSLLGLPIVLLGIFLLGKFHFRAYHWFSLASIQATSPRQFA